MACLLALKRSINSSFLFKTLNNSIRSISAQPSNSNAIATNPLFALRFFSARSRVQGSNMVEKRNIADHKRRLLVEKYELRRKLYKALCKDPDLPSEMRDKHRYKLSKLPRNSSVTREFSKSRCLDGRKESVLVEQRPNR